MSNIAQAVHTMAPRQPLHDALSPADAERLGHVCTPKGRAVVVGWPTPLFSRQLLPARMWLHKGPDASTNTLGWASRGEAKEVWFVSQGGRVDAYDLPALRKALLDGMRARNDSHPHDIVQVQGDQRQVYRLAPANALKAAHIGTFFPQGDPQ